MTKDEIKAKILATNPSRQYQINGEVFEMTDAEFDEAVNNRVEMEYAQSQVIQATQDAKAAAEAKLAALGLTTDDLKALEL